MIVWVSDEQLIKELNREKRRKNSKNLHFQYYLSLMVAELTTCCTQNSNFLIFYY
jgi:hypothetical protein